MADPPQREPSRMLAALAVQLERDRRAFLVGGVVYAAANLVLAGLAWAGAGGARLGWLPAAIAFLGNVFYALTTEWELRWDSVWRREVPRIERALGGEVLSPLIGEPGPRRIQAWLKWISRAIAVAWLVVLLLTIHAAGLRLGVTR